MATGGDFGHHAVMVFFVLSGYVIAHVTLSRPTTGADYGIGRVARLYSVVVPALVLTVALDSIGKLLDPTVYDGWWNVDTKPVIRFTYSLFFLNEIWFESVRAFTNGPYWSMGYEASYYLLFGLWCFAPGRWRIPVTALAALMVGPKILLLAPVWLMGVWTYRFNRTHTLSPSLALAVLVASSLAFTVFHQAEFWKAGLAVAERALGQDFVNTQLGYSRVLPYGLCARSDRCSQLCRHQLFGADHRARLGPFSRANPIPRCVHICDVLATRAITSFLRGDIWPAGGTEPCQHNAGHIRHRVGNRALPSASRPRPSRWICTDWNTCDCSPGIAPVVASRGSSKCLAWKQRYDSHSSSTLSY